MLQGGWHDIAGTVSTDDGNHHVFPGCDHLMGGWHHGVTADFVHFKEAPGAPRHIEETYAGMFSNITPCAGFVQKDDAGVPCAGFRQCGSTRGVAGGAPWDVPMEVRCATNDKLTEWSDPQFLFNVSYYRPIPYDPARPWKDTDGMWYMALSGDHCNDTTRQLPCESGGQINLYRSTKLRGATWEKVGPMYTTPTTVLKYGHLQKEFVTIEYIGNLTGDPHQGTTRVFLNNVGGNGGGEGCCSGTTSYTVGKQSNGGAFVPYVETNTNGVGMMDWAAFTWNTTSTATRGTF
jgi:hypothetical protein